MLTARVHAPAAAERQSCACRDAGLAAVPPEAGPPAGGPAAPARYAAAESLLKSEASGVAG
ncbi:hypothetical protein [Streptomyces coriariae]|uniref:hypothetical protein n=1 Tax=Streptomyces coriariae TaxID=2864460 RepID=UPI001E3144E0|nr:hypothetical protein [Streptomyces coriariae]